ncbi:MAG: hypothetical protein ACM359_08635 [Bacillota bacterium]
MYSGRSTKICGLVSVCLVVIVAIGYHLRRDSIPEDPLRTWDSAEKARNLSAAARERLTIARSANAGDLVVQANCETALSRLDRPNSGQELGPLSIVADLRREEDIGWVLRFLGFDSSRQMRELHLLFKDSNGRVRRIIYAPYGEVVRQLDPEFTTVIMMRVRLIPVDRWLEEYGSGTTSDGDIRIKKKPRIPLEIPDVPEMVVCMKNGLGAVSNCVSVRRIGVPSSQPGTNKAPTRGTSDLLDTEGKRSEKPE